MKTTSFLIVALLMAFATTVRAQVFPIPEPLVQAALAGRNGTFVQVECTTGAVTVFNPGIAREKLPPCSTFKIWNTLIGLESGLIASPVDPFYKWDGKTRAYQGWNKDLILREAFAVSCVPAYQELARRIGAGKMQEWINKIGYGDRDTSAGIDVFWLPAPGRKTILITPAEQAELISRLATGKVPFSAKSRAVLRDVMTVRKTDHGTLYGKTGSGTLESGHGSLGWFVGYVETRGKTIAFACAVKGEKADGKSTRALVETILEKCGYL